MKKSKTLVEHKAVTCSYCKHDYIQPCNGKNSKCQNKIYKDKNSS